MATAIARTPQKISGACGHLPLCRQPSNRRVRQLILPCTSACFCSVLVSLNSSSAYPESRPGPTCIVCNHQHVKRVYDTAKSSQWQEFIDRTQLIAAQKAPCVQTCGCGTTSLGGTGAHQSPTAVLEAHLHSPSNMSIAVYRTRFSRPSSKSKFRRPMSASSSATR